MAAALFMGTSCDDSEGLKVTEQVPNADKTLYEVLLADTELSDFVEVINSCGKHCADSLFNRSRVYTLWAPVNNTFNKDSLIEEAVEKGNREMVFQSFVKAHISNHLRAANGTLDEKNKILLLNEKIAVFKGDHKNGYTFAGQPLGECNIRVMNGVLHKLVAPAEYKYNIMEYLKIAENVDSVSEFIYSYNVTDFSPGQSILGPIVDGQQTYLDSVFVTNNRLMNHWDGVGFLENEDSTYTVYVPSNDVWTAFVEKSLEYFNYNLESANPTSVSAYDRDSLRNYYARMNALKFMTFSDNEQMYVESPDSMLPICQSGGKRVELPRAQLEDAVIPGSEIELSNGTFKVLGKCPFTFQELFHDTIKVEAEDNAMRYYYDGFGTEYTRSASKNQLNKDSLFADVKISGNAYLEEFTEGSIGNVYFKLPNVLSAKYKLAIITVPKNITNSDIPKKDLKPTSYTMTVSMGEEKLFVSAPLNSSKDRVDTLFLQDKGKHVVLDIPYCEYYNTYNHGDYNLTLQLTNGGFSFMNDMCMRLDAILLIPVGDEAEDETKE